MSDDGVIVRCAQCGRPVHLTPAHIDLVRTTDPLRGWVGLLCPEQHGGCGAPLSYDSCAAAVLIQETR